VAQVNMPVIIYDKWFKNVEYALPNVGRESHTYIRYIVDHYERLPEVIVFAQGNPFPHEPAFIERINSLDDDVTFCPLGRAMMTFDCNGRPDHWEDLPIRRIYGELFGEEFPEEDTCYSGGQFAVSGKRVTAREKRFYVQCLQYLDYCENPIEGYVFERLWHRIFGSCEHSSEGRVEITRKSV
jgi:hypothetical protein